MSAESVDKIRILILGSGQSDLTPIADFLNKRNFSVSIKTNLREGVEALVRTRSDWVLLSVNLGPIVDKFISVLKSSFNMDPILFADIVDRRSLSRLDQYGGHVLTSKITGPNIRMKIAQIIEDREQAGIMRHRLPPKATSGVKRTSFGHVHVKGVMPGTPNNGFATDMVGAPPMAPTIMTPDQLCVLVADASSSPGYYVVGATHEQMAVAKKNMPNRLFGPIVPAGDSDPKWEALCHKLVKQAIPGAGEVMSCFVPVVKPLPTYQRSTSDTTKTEVVLNDIPSQIDLPCALYIFLAQNQKYVCLIKKGGQLSTKQKDRLLKLGLEILLVANEDVEQLNYAYIREMIGAATA